MTGSVRGVYTEGPWRWTVSRESKHLALVGSRNETVLSPTRWGTSGATVALPGIDPRIGIDLLYKLHEVSGWVTRAPGCEHHASWCAGVNHPNMKLIESAPDLLLALQGLLSGATPESIAAAEAAIMRATSDGMDDSPEILGGTN